MRHIIRGHPFALERVAQTSIDISVVIPSYKHPQKIARCINSLLNQETTFSYEIIVVDSSPADMQSQVAAVCAIDNRINLIQLTEQTYPGAARNVGIQRAKGAIIGLIDADCEALPGWLTTIGNRTRKGFILTGVIENGTPESIYGTCSFLVEFNHFLDIASDDEELTGAATCNFACHRDVFEEIGYFTDDRAFEDILLCSKFINSGGKVLKTNDLRIKHNNKTDRAGVATNLEMLGKYSALVRKREGMPPKLVFSFPPLAFGLIVFRHLSITTRALRSSYALQFLLYTPWILYFLFCWTLGFYRGAVLGKRDC